MLHDLLEELNSMCQEEEEDPPKSVFTQGKAGRVINFYKVKLIASSIRFFLNQIQRASVHYAHLEKIPQLQTFFSNLECGITDYELLQKSKQVE